MKEKIHILACGPTGQFWDGKGYSIGVNDCWKYRPTNELLVVNHRNDFSPERQKIIDASTPLIFHTLFPDWKEHYQMVPLRSKYQGQPLDGKRLYYANSSAFCATNLAFNYGAKDIILWGVDFVGHQNIKGDKLLDEIKRWRLLYLELTKKGCKLWLGFNNTVMGQFLPTYENSSNHTN